MSIIGEMPRFALEAIIFGGMILVVIYLMSQSGACKRSSILALYAFVGYRLMPALQQIYNNAIRIKFTIPALIQYNDLKSLKPYNPSLRKDALNLNKK